MPCTYHNHTSTAVTIAPSHSLSIHTCNTNNSTHITVTATTASTWGTTTTSQTDQRRPHDYRPTTRTQPSSRSERNLIILQININGIKNKLKEFKLLSHNKHADIITIQETKLTPKANTPKVHKFTTVCVDRLHKAGSGLLTFITTDIPSTINTHRTTNSRCQQQLGPHNTPTKVPNTTLQQTSSTDISTVSNTLYNRTSWTTQHTLSSDHLPIITPINIRHDYNKTD